MNYVQINCHGAMLIAPEFLRPLWPFELPLCKWPSYCGAGDGIGDWIVPDTVHGVCISPICFIHDVDWALSPDSITEFMASNWRMLNNAISMINASDLTWIEKKGAILRVTFLYFGAVSTVGCLFFDGELDGHQWDGTEIQHPIVADRLRRLSHADLRIHGG